MESTNVNTSPNSNVHSASQNRNVEDLCHKIEDMNLSSSSNSFISQNSTSIFTGNNSMLMRHSLNAPTSSVVANPIADMDYVLGLTDRPHKPTLAANGDLLSVIDEQTETATNSLVSGIIPKHSKDHLEQPRTSSPGSAVSSSNATVRGKTLNTSQIMSFSDLEGTSPKISGFENSPSIVNISPLRPFETSHPPLRLISRSVPCPRTNPTLNRSIGSNPPIWSSAKDISIPHTTEFGSLSAWRSDPKLKSAICEGFQSADEELAYRLDLNASVQQHLDFRPRLPIPSTFFPTEGDDQDDDHNYIYGLTGIEDSLSDNDNDEHDIIELSPTLSTKSRSNESNNRPTQTTFPTPTVFANPTSPPLPDHHVVFPVTPERTLFLPKAQEDPSMTVQRSAIHHRLVDESTLAPFQDALLSLENISTFQSLHFSLVTPQRSAANTPGHEDGVTGSVTKSDNSVTPRPNDHLPTPSRHPYTAVSALSQGISGPSSSDEQFDRNAAPLNATPHLQSPPTVPVSISETHTTINHEPLIFSPNSRSYMYSETHKRSSLSPSRSPPCVHSQLHPSLSAALLKQAQIRSLQSPLPFTTLDISGFGIESLEFMDTVLPNLTSLTVAENKLAFLEGVPATVRTLLASYNRLAPLTSFHHLCHSLHLLDICGNHMDDLFPLKCLVHLQVLRADNNGIRTWDKVPSMPTLRVLSLRQNMIAQVDGSLADLPALNELDLTSNAVSNVHDLELGMPQLHKLILVDNALQGPLPGSHSKVTHLSLRDNMISSIDAQAWPSLDYLELEGNTIRQINLEVLDHVTYVGLACQEHMVSDKWKRSKNNAQHTYEPENSPLINNDSGTPNNEVPARILAAPFDGADHEYLIEDMTFDYSDLQGVSRLVLNKNTLSPLDQFVHMYQLVNLSLVGCGLRSLPARFSRHAPSLRMLDLSQNCIHDVSPLSKLTRLRSLSLKGNDITDYFHVVGYLGHLSRLEDLDMRQNPLTGLFYPNLVVRDNEPAGNDWARLDLAYQKSLNDSTVVKRCCYRTSLIFHLRTSLKVLDKLVITDCERREVPVKYTRMERSLAAIMGRTSTNTSLGNRTPVLSPASQPFHLPVNDAPTRQTIPGQYTGQKSPKDRMSQDIQSKDRSMQDIQPKYHRLSQLQQSRGGHAMDLTTLQRDTNQQGSPYIDPAAGDVRPEVLPCPRPTHILPSPSVDSLHHLVLSHDNADGDSNANTIDPNISLSFPSWANQYGDLTSETEILNEIRVLAGNRTQMHLFRASGLLPCVDPASVPPAGNSLTHISPARTAIGPT